MAQRDLLSEEFNFTYSGHRDYVFPEINNKHQREYNNNFWVPCEFKSEMSVLELGCGTGIFLEYLKQAGINNFLGVDSDPKILEFLPDDLKSKVKIEDIFEYLLSLDDRDLYDRVVLLDILQLFTSGDGANLLELIKPCLKKGGGIVVRVPNVASPWGHQYQFGDISQKRAYTPDSLRQIGLRAGYKCKVFEYRKGNAGEQVLENMFHSFIGLLFTDSPEFWSAQIVGFFRPSI